MDALKENVLVKERGMAAEDGRPVPEAKDFKINEWLAFPKEMDKDDTTIRNRENMRS